MWRCVFCCLAVNSHWAERDLGDESREPAYWPGSCLLSVALLTFFRKAYHSQTYQTISWLRSAVGSNFMASGEQETKGGNFTLLECNRNVMPRKHRLRDGKAIIPDDEMIKRDFEDNKQSDYIDQNCLLLTLQTLLDAKCWQAQTRYIDLYPSLFFN